MSSRIELESGEFVVSGYINNGYHYAVTNFGNLWFLDWRYQWVRVK